MVDRLGGGCGGEVVLDGDGECRAVLVAEDLAELGFGFEQAGGRTSAGTCRRSAQCLTFLEVLQQVPIIDLIVVVEDSVRQSCSSTPRRCSVSVLARPSASEAAARGWECASSPASAPLQGVLMVGELPGGQEVPLDA